MAGQGCFNNSSEENFVNYVAGPPSLQSIALTSVAVQLWQKSDMKNFTEERYEACEKMVVGKLTHISLPDSLIKELIHFIRHIGLQRLRFNSFDTADRYRHKIWNPIYWTMDGMIDIPTLIKEDILATMNESNHTSDLTFLFTKACEYCIDEKIIHKLWLVVRNDSKFYSGYYRLQTEYELYWSLYFENKLQSMLPIWDEYGLQKFGDISSCANMVAFSIFAGNSFAFKYFWSKLTPEEKSDNIESWLLLCLEQCDDYHRMYWSIEFEHPFLLYEKSNEFLPFVITNTDDEFCRDVVILLFLLSKVPYLKQREMFYTYLKLILQCMLSSWHTQKFFIPTIAAMPGLLQAEECFRIATNITTLIREKMVPSSLLIELWQLCSSKLKKYFINSLAKDSTMIMRLIEMKDVLTIRFIFNDGSESEVKNIILNIIKENNSKVPDCLQNSYFMKFLI